VQPPIEQRGCNVLLLAAAEGQSGLHHHLSIGVLQRLHSLCGAVAGFPAFFFPGAA
jgi:hypothetical protein